MLQKIPGDLHVANDVLSDIAGHAALECYGIVGMAAPHAEGLGKMLPTGRLHRGVVVDATDDGVKVDLFVIMEYGTNINTVSHNLIEQVTFALSEFARVPIAGVDVHVQGVKVRR